MITSSAWSRSSPAGTDRSKLIAAVRWLAGQPGFEATATTTLVGLGRLDNLDEIADLCVDRPVLAVRNAERTGQVGPVMSSMADFLDEENEVIVKSLTSLVEPLILITLGLVVGFVAVSMFLPLFDLTSTAGGGGGAP